MNETENRQRYPRVSVAISREAHAAMAPIAKILGKDIRTAVDEAVRDWNERNRVIARKRANQLLAA